MSVFVLRRLVGALEQTRHAVVRVDSKGADQLAVWGWVCSELAKRFPDLDVQPLHLRARQDASDPSLTGLSEYRLLRGRWDQSTPAPEDVVHVDFPVPDHRDLIAVMYECRREMSCHHGLLITREAQRRAFERAIGLGTSAGSCLCRAFEILDGAVLAHRQHLLSLSQSRSDVESIDSALGAIALVVEQVLADGDAFAGKSHQHAAAVLLAATRTFQSTVDAVGGPPRAAFIRPSSIDRYSDVAL